MMGKDQKASC